MGQKRHCPGVKDCMAARGESIDSLGDVAVKLEFVSGLDERLIAVVVVVVVVVAVPSINEIRGPPRLLSKLSS